MKRLIVNIFIGAVICALGCSAAWAQATGQISGTVKDQSGAVLPGVEITATQTDTGVARMTITNETGSYVLPSLPVGPYRVEAALPGFRTFAQTGIILQVNSSPVVNPVLEVGQVTEAIEVQANAALVETRNAGVGQIIENAQILELPLNGRQVTELISLAGAATPGVGGTDTRNPFNKESISIAGGVAFGVAYVLDGANHNAPYNNLNLSVPFPDALQEFRVETSATSARSGMHSAGSVNLVTKSGTNQFHGTLFEFVRNGKFNARNFFSPTRDTLKRNQFGGTLGGPVLQNKLFFFGGYQGTTVRQDPADRIAFVPTAQMLAGDFTAFASPACNVGRQTALRAPFVNNRVDPALFSRPALNIVAKLPQSNDPCGRVVYANRNIENQHMAVGKIDYQWSANHSIFGRYLVDSLVIPHPYSLNQNLLSTAASGSDSLNQAFTVGSTYLFGPNVVNAFRLTANRSATLKTAAEFFSLPEIGVNMFTYIQKYGVVNVTGGFNVSSIGNSHGPTRTSSFAASDEVSLLRGNHQMAFGGMLSHWRTNLYSNAYAGGIFAFNGQITGLGVADFLTGNAFNLSQAPNETYHIRQWYAGLFGADTWRATPKLTVNYGVRWEPYFPMQHANGYIYHLDLDALRGGVKTTQYRNAPPGIFYPGDPGFPGKAGMNKQWKNFSPRVGLAWDPQGDGRTSVRASFGMFHEFVPAQFHISTAIAPPFEPRLTATNVRFEDPWRNFPGGNPFPAAKGADAPFTFYSLFASMDYDTPNPSVTQWNLSVQRQLGTDWLVSASYLGSNTIHLWASQALNPSVYLPGASCVINGVTWTPCSSTANTNERRVLSLENPATGRYFGFVNRIDSGATASYNGLLLSVQRRASRGLTLNGNYTWSHCISDPMVTSINGGTGNGAYSFPNDRRADRGNCTTSATDRRHVFNLTAVSETPQFANPTLRAIAGGWRLSPILRIQTGSFLTVTTTNDAALNSIGNQRVNQLLANPYGDKSVSNYLNPAAFALPATGTLGNMGNSNIEGPGYWQFDVALSKTFRFRETHRVEFRAEAFNVTNSLRMDNPTTNINSNIFGQVTTARDPRIMQFALKYVF